MRTIPLKKCKNGYLYLIDGRNASLGIFDASKKAFAIARRKFGDVFVDLEWHWAVGRPHGTAKPTKELEEAPMFDKDEPLLEYLQEKYKEHVKEK